MAWQDDAEPGVYEAKNGDIWEKRRSGRWFVNGALWTPFPEELMVIDDFRLAKRMEREDKEALRSAENKFTGEIKDAETKAQPEA